VAGVAFDVEAQIVLDKIVKGAGLDASIKDITKKISKQMDEGITPSLSNVTKTITQNLIKGITQGAGQTVKTAATNLPTLGGMPVVQQAGRAGAGALGAIAAPILALTAVIVALIAIGATMVSNSKVLAKVIEFWNMSMGLLMDLILIPFLPMIALLMVGLIKAIVAFGMWWKDIWDTIKKEGLLGLLKLALDAAWGVIDPLIKTILEFLFGSNEKKKEMLLNLLANFLEVPTGLLEAILKFIFGESMGANIMKVLGLTVQVFKDAIGVLWTSILDFVFGTNKSKEAKLKFIADIKELKGLWDYIMRAAFMGLAPKTIKLDLLLNLIDPLGIRNIIGSALGWTKEGAMATAAAAASANAAYNQDLINKANTTKKIDVGGGVSINVVDFVENLPTAAIGGHVQKGGAVIVHDNEDIVPAGKGGHTFNFYGYQDDQFIKKVKDVVRGQGAQHYG